ncbi:MAG: hypothetical protein NT069_35145, partial [Planctomycetota bacterium]|nr:hypothetical protein [Planctomycetota bacterium]
PTRFDQESTPRNRRLDRWTLSRITREPGHGNLAASRRRNRWLRIAIVPEQDGVVSRAEGRLFPESDGTKESGLLF